MDSTNPSKGLAGARFKVASENGSYEKEIVTGQDGTYTLSGLEANTYAVTETAPLRVDTRSTIPARSMSFCPAMAAIPLDQFLALAKKYTNFSVLTTPMIYEFVDKILVHALDRSTGDRTQEVDIYLKFIGKFDVPLPEPTAEELAEMEKQRKQRAYYHERSKR
ncbi:DUF4368 domain-containing protein [Oscillibacter sp.]|uniref:DUF4368 domain-containing protein n=1 Tax=Oscillibacter sp. TaxID=1945593 RepID=UPI002D7F2B89|nr:DUF4368 domain-containing protein [Oscillibacter sp.]